MRFRPLGLLAAAAVLVLAQAAPAHAADTTPPTAPGTPVASDLTEYSVRLTWEPSTDDTGVDHYEVYRLHTDVVQRVASPTEPAAAITGLGRGSVSRFYVVAFDAAGNRSPQSPWITVTTLPGDLEPPGPVFGLTATEITDTSTRITWIGAFWGDVDQFRIYRMTDSGGSTLLMTVPATTRTVVLSGLLPGTRYIFGVSALDAAGNENPPSRITVTTTGVPRPTCVVTYRVVSRWATGFIAEVRMTNLSATAINGWRLRWTFADGQTVTSLWSGVPTQSGARVIVANMAYNAVIGANGGSQSFGFIAAWSGTNTSPTDFSLNDLPCLAD